MLQHDNTWACVTTHHLQQLQPWSTLQFVSTGGTAPTIYGSAGVQLELEGHPFAADMVVISPLTSEAILGLNFLQEQEASINLLSRRLHLRGRGCDLTLRDPTPLCAQAMRTVHAGKKVAIPPCSVLEVKASLDAPVEGVWSC